MRYLVVLACLFVAAHGIPKELMDQMKAQMIKLGGECKGEIGAADEDIAPMMAHQPPTTPKGKCFVACINKKMGFQDASGKISEAGTRIWLNQLKTMDDELYTKMKQVCDNCLAEVTDAADECETAAKVFVCVQKEKQAVGMPDMDFNS